MKFAIKHIVAAAAFVAVGAASASTVAVGGTTTTGYTLNSGSGSLSFSSGLLSALNLAGMSVSAVSPATVSTTSSGGDYTAVSVTASVTSLAYNATTNVVTDAYTTGGATITAVADGATNTGGYLSIENLHFDLANKVVYATLVGGNSVGTVSNLALWNIGTITGSTTLTSGSTTLSFSSLTFYGGSSGTAFTDFATALGLTTIGKKYLATVTDFGTITATINASASAAAVPEPSTYALMGLGLAGMGLVARRRAK